MPDAEAIAAELAKADSMDDFFGKEGIFAKLFANTLEQMMEAKLTDQLGYEPYEAKGRNSGNSRNGYYSKKVRTSVAGDYASIGNQVFFDANGDGIFNGSDYGIPGVTVVLAVDLADPGNINAGEVIATATTDEFGQYSFDGLPDGNYLVAVTDTDNVLGELAQIIGSSGSADNHSKDQPYAVTLAGSDNNTADFGFAPPNHNNTKGLIGDFIFLDANANNSQDAGDQGLEGVVVELCDAAGTTTLQSTTTDENGYYYFGNLAVDPSTIYTIKVDTSTLPPGLTNNVDPNGGNDSTSQTTLSTATKIDLTQDFGYKFSGVSGSIGNQVWEDTDADGLFEAGEQGINDVTLDLYWDKNGDGKVDPGEPVISRTVTDSSGGNGTYGFSNLPTNGATGINYIVDVTDVDGVLSGWWHSLGTTGDNQSKVDPYGVELNSSNTSDTTVDFGYYLDPANLGDFVWLDTIENNIQDSSEPGINAVPVQLVITYPGGDKITLVVPTSGDGQYSFENLLMDEDFNGIGSATNCSTGAGGDEPCFTVSVKTDPVAVARVTPGAGAPDVDSNNHDGSQAFPVQGSEDDTFDFGYKNEQTLLADLGDLPTNYPTLLANNGAINQTFPDGDANNQPDDASAVWLGDTVDYESEGQPTVDALGDDNNGINDEDGVDLSSIIWNPGTTTSLNVTVTSNSPQTADVLVLFDWNNNGSFNDPGDGVYLQTANVPAGTGGNPGQVIVPVSFEIPADFDPAVTPIYIRARVFGAQVVANAAFGEGLVINGEVEDYHVGPTAITLQDFTAVNMAMPLMIIAAFAVLAMASVLIVSSRRKVG